MILKIRKYEGILGYYNNLKDVQKFEKK